MISQHSLFTEYRKIINIVTANLPRIVIFVLIDSKL